MNLLVWQPASVPIIMMELPVPVTHARGVVDVVAGSGGVRDILAAARDDCGKQGIGGKGEGEGEGEGTE